MNVQIRQCDARRIADFLDGRLNDSEQAVLEEHLSTCEACRASLGAQTADDELWDKASRYLRDEDEEIESPPGAGDSAAECDQAYSIQHVLDALGPTDDPAMLGRLGAYEISGVVGSGGMGVVLKAFDRSLDRTVAIKVMAPHLATNGAARKRFAREAKAAAAVLHPNVMAIHSVSSGDSLPFLVMPYLRGTSLQKRLDAEGPLPVGEILRIAAQTAAGLAAAHAQGLIHRDIKPANILLEEGVERVAITDFGLARAVDDASMTRTGVVAGTPQYMSPEQARGEPLGQSSDLFSLGSVLYAMCTGRPPFRAESSYGVLRRITDDEPKSIREINPDIPEWLCLLISRLMAKSPDARFGNALEVAALLEQCLAHVQQPTSVPLPASLVPHAAGRRSIFNVTRKGVLAMLGTIGMTLLGMMLWQATEAPDISGQWTSDEWGTVVLEAKGPGEYEGTFSGSAKDKPVVSNEASGGSPGTEPGVTLPMLGFGWIRAKDSVIENQVSLPAGRVKVLGDGLAIADVNGDGQAEVYRQDGNRPAPVALDFPGKFEDVASDTLRGVKFPVYDKVATTSGTLHLKWSRLERRFNGTWGKGDNRTGTMSLRPVDKEIRGGWTTDEDAQLESGTPLLGDLLWKRRLEPNDKAITNVRYDVSELIGGATNEQADSVLRQLCSLIAETIEPESWKGDEFIIVPHAQNSSIVVRQTGARHAAIRDLLKQLRELKHRETANTAADNQEPLDRQNARAVVEAFVAAAISGRIDEAASLVDQTELAAQHRPAFRRQMEVFSRRLNGQRLAMESVYVNDLEKPVTALATSQAVELERQQPGGQRDFFLMVTLTMSKEGWLVTIGDFESEESADRELKKFLEANPKAINVPPQAASETAKSPADKISAIPTRVKYFTASDGKKIACSPDGKLIAVANGGKAFPAAEGWKRTVEILDAETGKTAVSMSLTTQEEDALLAATEGPRDFEVGALAFSPDGRLLAVGTGLGQVKLFDSRTGKLVLSLDDEPAKLAEQKTPEKLKSIKRAMGSIGSLAFSSDGTRLAMSGRSFADAAPNWGGVHELGRLATGPGRLKVWEVKTGVLIHDLAGHSHANAVSFSPDGNLLASAGHWSGENGTGVIIWNAWTGTQLHTLTNEANGGTHAVVFSPTGNLVAIGSRHFDKANDTSTTTVSLAHAMSGITEWEQAVLGWAKPAFSPDGNSLLVLCGGGSIQFLDTETGTVKHNIGLADTSQGARWNDFALLPQGRLAIAGMDNSRNGKVEIWDFTGPNIKASAIEKPLDRQNARAVVEAFVAAAIGRDVAKAAALAKSAPPVSKRLAEFPRLLNVERLAISKVYVNDPANPTEALATSEGVKLENEHKQPNGERDCFLVFTVSMGEEGWIVRDVIDIESEESADGMLKKFLEANPKAINVPALREAQSLAARVNPLVGHWKVVKLADMPLDQLAGATVVIDEHRVKMHVPSQKGPHPDWRYTLGANGDIDLVDADDVKGESIARAKYSLQGNTLYLALNAKKGDHPRPESATGEAPQEGVQFIVLESDEEAQSSEAAKAPDAGRGTREGHPQASEQPALSKTLQQLQGKWHLTRQIAADGDESITPASAVWEFNGHRIIVKDGGPGGVMLIELDESHSPVHVDVTLEGSDESGLGRLSVEGDIDEITVPRPADEQEARVVPVPLGENTIQFNQDVGNNETFLFLSTAPPEFDPILGLQGLGSAFWKNLIGVNRMPLGKTTVIGAPNKSVYAFLFAADNSPGFAAITIPPPESGMVRLPAEPFVAGWSDGRKTPPPKLAELMEFMKKHELTTQQLLEIPEMSNANFHAYQARMQELTADLSRVIELPEGESARVGDLLAADGYRRLQK